MKRCAELIPGKGLDEGQAERVISRSFRFVINTHTVVPDHQTSGTIGLLPKEDADLPAVPSEPVHDCVRQELVHHESDRDQEPGG